MTNHKAYLIASVGALVCAIVGCGGDSKSGNAFSDNVADGGGGPDSDVGGDATPDRTVTTVEIQNPSSEAESDVPVTFGHVFARGDVPKGKTLVARIGQAEVPLQVDVKARHADGSLRHAILTVSMSTMAAGQRQPVELATVSEAAVASPAPVDVKDLLATDFDASVTLTPGGKSYSLAARPLLQDGAAFKWLSGKLVSEWIVSGPVAASGTAHPHLNTRFSVRAYAGMKRVRVAVMVENDWAFEKDPQNFVYDASVRVGGAEVYQKSELTHYRQARWRKVFWWGEGPHSEARQNARYLMESGALPNYDPSLVISEAALSRLETDWAALDTSPMKIGPLTSYMPGTGAHPDIGPLSRWDALYLVSMDTRARAVAMGIADLAGSWSTHYRDKDTGLPVTLVDYPYMSLLGNSGDKVNPKTKKSEAFPACAEGAECKSPYTWDSPHQPSLGYLAYVVGGDYDHLEELQFWANVNILEANPSYRKFEKGLLKWNQVRGQAWSLRTLGFAAFITPDDHPLKKYFNDRVEDNLSYYLDRYTNTDPNALGVLTDGYAFGYNGGRGVAPWMDDFFTWSVGHLVSMGFERAVPLLAFKAKFSVGRMTDPGFCRIKAAAYAMNVRDDDKSPLYDTFAKVYEQTIEPELVGLPCGGPEMAAALKLKEGELTGYSSSVEGYPSNMQPALAVAVESGIPNAQQAWDLFEQRSVKPDYSANPHWAITPRPQRHADK